MTIATFSNYEDGTEARVTHQPANKEYPFVVGFYDLDSDNFIDGKRFAEKREAIGYAKFIVGNQD